MREESQHELYLVACEHKMIVGMAALGDNELAKFYVEPTYHRLGIGTLLFREAEEIILSKGYSGMNLTAVGVTPVPFYEAMGMSLVGYKKTPSGRLVTPMKKKISTVSGRELRQ